MVGYVCIRYSVSALLLNNLLHNGRDGWLTGGDLKLLSLIERPYVFLPELSDFFLIHLGKTLFQPADVLEILLLDYFELLEYPFVL